MPLQSLLHLNTSVYELAEDADGNTHPLMKQVNNTIPVTQVFCQRKVDVTYNELVEAYKKFTEGDGVKEHKTFWLYPLKETQLDERMNFTIVHGIMMDVRKNDPMDLPMVSIPVNATKEEETAAKLKQLRPYSVPVGFMMAIPETKKLMFDVSLSHIPPEAVSQYVPGQPAQNDDIDMAEELPFGLDPNEPYVSHEDMEKIARMRGALEQQVREALGDDKDAKLPEGFAIDEDRLKRDAGFESEEEYLTFRRYFEAPAQSSSPDLTDPK